MMALHARSILGMGQHVDVSIQQCLSICTMNALQFWDMYKINLPRGVYKRGQVRSDGSSLYNPWLWPCKDGWVFLMIGGGVLRPMVLSSTALVEWMAKRARPAASRTLTGRPWIRPPSPRWRSIGCERRSSLFSWPMTWPSCTRRPSREESCWRRSMMPGAWPRARSLRPGIFHRDRASRTRRRPEVLRALGATEPHAPDRVEASPLDRRTQPGDLRRRTRSLPATGHRFGKSRDYLTALKGRQDRHGR